MYFSDKPPVDEDDTYDAEIPDCAVSCVLLFLTMDETVLMCKFQSSYVAIVGE
jgi:hypothetical protein